MATFLNVSTALWNYDRGELPKLLGVGAVELGKNA